MIELLSTTPVNKPHGVRYFFIGPIRGRAAGHSIVFGLSVLNRVCILIWQLNYNHGPYFN